MQTRTTPGSPPPLLHSVLVMVVAAGTRACTEPRAHGESSVWPDLKVLESCGALTVLIESLQYELYVPGPWLVRGVAAACRLAWCVLHWSLHVMRGPCGVRRRACPRHAPKVAFSTSYTSVCAYPLVSFLGFLTTVISIWHFCILR